MIETNNGSLARPRVRKSGPLTALGSAFGCTEGLDPIPPSQYRFFRHKSQPGLQRLLAWMREHTIAYRPQPDGGDGRTVFATDSHGKALSLSHLARDLGWALPNASREWKRAEDLGLVSREGKKLFLSGNVPPIRGENTTRNVICTDNLPQAICKKIKGWPKHKQVEFSAAWKPALELAETLKARRIAEAREEIIRLQDSILFHFGLERKHKKDRKPQAPIELPNTLTRFVQITLSGAVQITSNAACTDNQTLSCTQPLSILPTENFSEKHVPPSSSAVIADLAARLMIDDDAARRIWEACSARNPEVQPDELATLAGYKLRQVGKRVGNAVGLLITALPQMVTGALWHQARKQCEQNRDIERLRAEEWAKLEAELLSSDQSPVQ